MASATTYRPTHTERAQHLAARKRYSTNADLAAIQTAFVVVVALGAGLAGSLLGLRLGDGDMASSLAGFLVGLVAGAGIVTMKF